MTKKQQEKPFKVVVTRLVSEHDTEKAARTALKKLKPEKGALGVVIQTTGKGKQR